MKNERTVRRVLAFGVVLIGISALSWGSVRFKKTQDSLAWPTVKGQVVSSQIVSKSGSDHTVYAPRVEYSYAVNGQAYKSHRVSFGNYADSRHSVARSIVGRYHSGQEVTVHYNPADYAEAVLEPGVVGGLYIPLSVGFACFFVGIIGMFS